MAELMPAARIATPQQPKKIMAVFGTRPEGSKIAPLILALREDPRFKLVSVHTGQHREMLTPVLEWFGFTPDHMLENIMSPGQPLAHLSGKLLAGLHGIMEAEQPDVVMAVGDTTTAFMAALSAHYAYDYYVRTENTGNQARRHYIEFAHIEAGLRTGNLHAPFPEEANRRMIGQIAHWHFAPTGTAAQALFDENITANVHITGNTAIDALHLTVGRLASHPRPLPENLPQDILSRKFILITGHRRENYGEGFDHICQAIRTLATRYPDVAFVYPVHLNQHVRGPVMQQLSGIANVHLTAPQDYPDFVNLLRHCHIVLTDSGGIQEEAPALGKPVLVMRDLTERPEGIAAGTARIVGTTAEKIASSVAELLDDPAAYEKMANAINPYGDGSASRRILNLLAGDPVDDNIFHGGTNNLAISASKGPNA